MQEDYIETNENKKMVQKIKNFLTFNDFLYEENLSVQDNIKKLCVKKLCKVIGIKIECNYKNQFFNYFSDVTGEAICQLLNIPIRIADGKFKFVKYNGINFVEHVKELLKNDFLEDAYIDVFQFLEDNKHIFNIE